MSRSLLEIEERPILERIWNLDLQFEKIPEWFSQFGRFSTTDFIRKGFGRKDKKPVNSKVKTDNSLGFCRSRILVLLSYGIHFNSEWKDDVDEVMLMYKLDDFKAFAIKSYCRIASSTKVYNATSKSINSAKMYQQLVTSLDRIFHIINEEQPITLQFIKNAMEVTTYIINNFSVQMIVTELLGLLTEVYLMITTCLPSSSLLLQRSSVYGISCSQKLLLEIMYFQLFSFPLLSWCELKPEVSMILNISDLPLKVNSVFSVLYFIYENTSFNTSPSSKSLCDRVNQASAKTLLAYHMSLRRAATEMGIGMEVLRVVINRMLQVLGEPVYTRESTSFPLIESRHHFKPTLRYLKVPGSMLYSSDDKLNQLLYRAYADYLTNMPIIDVDNPRFEGILKELYMIETRDLSVLESYYMWLCEVCEFISQNGIGPMNDPSPTAYQLCTELSSMKDSEYSKGFAAYKRLLIHQYQLAYLNNSSFEHTNNTQCCCCHCSLSHILRSGNMNQVYCRYCCQRFNPSVQSTCNNLFAHSSQAHELSSLFEVLPPEEVHEASEQGFLDLTESSSSQSFYIRLTVPLNDITHLINRDKTADQVIQSVVCNETSRLTELMQFLSSPSYTDSNCSEDWLQLKLLKALSLRLSLISSISVFSDKLKKEFQILCIHVLEPLCNLLMDKWNQQIIPQNRVYRAVVTLAYEYVSTREYPAKNLVAQEKLLDNNDMVLDLCFYLAHPCYVFLARIDALHTLLLNRNQSVYEAIIRENQYPANIMELLKLFYSLTTSEDIEDLDRIGMEDSCDCRLNTHELSVILTVIKKKEILDYYTHYCQEFQPRMSVMCYLAGCHQHYQEESLGTFIDRQQHIYLQQIARYSEIVRKYNTNRYLAEYCFSLRVCYRLKCYLFASNPPRTRNDSLSSTTQRKNSVCSVPSDHYLSHQLQKTGCIAAEDVRSENSSVNEENYILEERSCESVQEGYYNRESSQPFTIPTTQMATSTRPYTNILQAYSPASTGVTGMPIFNNNLCTMYNSVIPLAVRPATMSDQSKQRQTQQKVQLPPSFHYLILTHDTGSVYNLYTKMIDGTPDSMRINFFFSYVVLWLFSSKSLRSLIYSGSAQLSEKASQSTTPNRSPAIQPTNPSGVPSLSPSIQPICSALNVTPTYSNTETEMEAITELMPEIERIMNSSELVRINGISVAIAEKFVKLNLLSKYQQFGCTEDAVDYLLISLHHRMNTLCSPPTSIVDYMRCPCMVHKTIGLRYSFKLRCGCDADTPSQFKSTLWVTLQGHSYHSVIREKLDALEKQPSVAAKQVATELAIQQTFSRFIKQSLLPYKKQCLKCHMDLIPEFQLEEEFPRVLLIRFSWSTSFPMNETDLTFCGIPEKIHLEDIHPSGKGTYVLRSVLVRNKENGEAIVCWSDVMKCYVLYALTWSASMEKFEYVNSYCSQLRFQPLLLLYDIISEE